VVEKKQGFLQKLFSSNKLAETKSLPTGVTQVNVSYNPIGSSGIQNYAGYYGEEYLSTLNGRERADFYDRMRRSDPKLKMLTSAVKNPIKAAGWPIDAADDSDEQKKIAEFVEFVLFEDMDKSWTATLQEILSFIEQGYSIFERVDKVVLGHKKYGNYNGIRSLAFRSQRTIERFNLDHQTGKLISVSQYAFGDLQRLVDIPSEYLIVFTPEKEGDNYEGISWLRPCVGPYKRKDHHLKLEAIGIEKYAIPTPILKIAEGKENSDEKAIAEDVMQRYITHQQQYISIPAGWAIDFLKNDFDPSKIRAAIDKDNVEMVHAFLANFLELGQSGSGSYALSFDLSDFFLSSIEHVANFIAEEINRCVIPSLVKLNFGPQESYPKMRVTGITDKAGKELAEVLKILADGKIIVPDDELEDDVRERYGLSPKSDVGQRKVDPQTQAPAATLPASEIKNDSLKLAEPKKQITDDKAALKQFMQTNLKNISDSMIQQLMGAYRNSSPANRLGAINKVSPIGQQDYQRQLLGLLSSISTRALEQARREVPKKKDVKLTEKLDSIRLDEFDRLPLDVQKRLKAQSQLLVGTQISDLEKNIFFQYQSSSDSTDSESLIEADLTAAAEKYVDGSSIDAAASVSAATTVNDARNAFFMDDEVSDEIESYTFVNADPVSPICQDLAGTVFAKDDPNLDRYWPPLHYNCKSYISPNLKGKENKPLTDGGLKPSKASLEKYINLSEADAQGLAVQSILISKEVAKTAEAAKSIALEYKLETANSEELETGYRFISKDASLFMDGSMRSFKPIHGVEIYIGLLKPVGVSQPIVSQKVQPETT
jgi:SPP1 gp7 family putative phage head morphogenesis protein